MPLLSWILLFLEGFAVYFMKPEANDLGLSAIVIATNVSVLMLETLGNERDREMAKYIFVGIVFRVSLLVWDVGFSDVFTLPNSGADSMIYSNWAESVANGGSAGRGGMYSRFLAVFYVLFGAQPPIAQYVNIMLFVTMLWFIRLTLNEVGASEQTQVTACAFLCLLPNTAIMNIALIRETIIAFLVTASVYCGIKWYTSDRWTWLAASFAICMASSTFHSGTLAVVVGEAVFATLYNKDTDGFDLEPKVLARAIFVLVAMLVLSALFGESVLNHITGNETVDSVVEDSGPTGLGNSDYDIGISSGNNMVNFIVNTPLRMFYFVASPLPWNWRGLRDVIAFCFSALFYVQAYRFAVRVLRLGHKTRHHSLILFLLILALASAFMFGWGVHNAGTALRHREKFVTIYLLLYCVCKEDLLKEPELKRSRVQKSLSRMGVRASVRGVG